MPVLNSDGFKILLKAWADIMAENRQRLIELDSIVGDSDLGLTMSDGFAAAYESANQSAETDIGRLAYFAGKAMSTAVPSTMGTLMASGLMNAGKALRGKSELSAADTKELFQAYFDGVKMRGKAELGDKTFLDGWPTALELLSGATDENIAEIAQKAAEAAEKDFNATVGMLAKHGRAAARGEKSRELLDPGAAVAALLMKGFSDTVCQTANK